MTPNGVKTCFKCGAIKPLTEFYKHKAMTDGLLGKCKCCAKKDSATRRIEKIEYVQQYDRNRPNHRERTIKCSKNAKLKYENNAEAKLKRACANKKWRHGNSDKKKAHLRLRRAILNGSVIKPNFCSVCSDAGDIEGHHWSYEEHHWLDVIWLCTQCHGKEHKKINTLKRKGEIYERYY